MSLDVVQLLLVAWFAVANAVAFGLAGYDKWQAGRGGARVSEAALCGLAALGGWPGGLAGLLMFRHKTAKVSFQLKFAAAFLVWAGVVWGAWRMGR